MTDHAPPEVSLMAASIASRDAYEAVRTSGELAAFQGSAESVWQAVGEFYARDPDAKAVDVALLADLVHKKIASPKKQVIASQYIDTIKGYPVSLPNVAGYLESAARARVGNELAAAIAMKRDQSTIDKLLEEYRSIAVRFGKGEEEKPVDWADILKRRAGREGGIFMSPKGLNKILGGGLLPGHNVTIFGRPESGKTAVSINAAVGFARKGFKVLYVGNEDPVEDLALRAMCNITGRTADDLLRDPQQAEQEAISLGISNLVFRDISPGTLDEVERMVRLYEPKVLVVDQLRNLLGGRSDNFTQHLDRMAQGVRALGKKYGLVTVSVTQAGDSARGKAILHDGDIDSSNTGIPGAADVLIGVAMTDEMDKAGIRNLCVCKNKLTGVHEAVQVKLQPQLSRVRSD